jgi:hypothetical protein
VKHWAGKTEDTLVMYLFKKINISTKDNKKKMFEQQIAFA